MKKLLSTLLGTMLALTGMAQELPKQSVSLGLSAGNANQLSLFSLPVTYRLQTGLVDGLYYTAGFRQNLAFGRNIFTINTQNALIDDLSNYSLNIMVGAEYHVKSIFIGFNIDLLGINTGTRSYKTVGTDPVYKINPEQLNIAGTSGCTNNEFYLGYAFTQSFSAKMGVSYYNMALTYQNRTISETSAYAGKLLPMLNIQYNIWQK